MATLVYVVGRSGSGKSTSICPITQVGIQGLNPDETILINTDQKPLPAPLRLCMIRRKVITSKQMILLK